MATTASKTPKRKWPAIVLVVVTHAACLRIRLWDRTPAHRRRLCLCGYDRRRAEVSGRIVELPFMTIRR